MSRRAICLVLGCLALLTPATGIADRVVLGPIRGDGREVIHRRIETVLSERLDVIPWEEFRAGYQGTGAQVPGAEAVRLACQHVRARRVVLGDVNSRRSVLLIAMSCESGEVDIQQEVQLINGVPERTALADAMTNLVPEGGASPRRAGPEAAGGARPTAVENALQPAVGAPEPPEEGEPVFDANAIAEEDPSEATPADPATARESAFIASATFAGRGTDAQVGGGGSVLDDEAPAVSSESSVDASADQTMALSYLEASIGASLATRTLEVPIVGGETVGYAGGGYTEVGVQGTVFPLGPLVRARWARMVGLSGSFTKGVVMPQSEGTNPLETDAVDWSFGLIGRYQLGGPVGFEVRPSIALGQKGFAIAPNDDVATFNYRFVRLGAEGRLLLVGRRLAIGLSGGYRIVSDLGEAAQAYGDQSKGAGWDIGGFASFVIGRFVEVSAGGELVTFSGAYDGVGTLERRQAITSTDSFPRGFLRAGIILR